MTTSDLTSELLCYDATFTDIVPIGVFPNGMRLDAHYSGTMTAGPLQGASVRGIDYVLIRPDGTSVLDVRAVITTRSGQPIEVRASGYGQLSTGASPSSVASAVRGLAPVGAAALTGSSALLGAAYCHTAADELAVMNRTVFIYSGTVDMARRTLSVAIRALAREMIGAAALAGAHECA